MIVESRRSRHRLLSLLARSMPTKTASARLPRRFLRTKSVTAATATASLADAGRCFQSGILSFSCGRIVIPAQAGIQRPHGNCHFYAHHAKTGCPPARARRANARCSTRAAARRAEFSVRDQRAAGTTTISRAAFPPAVDHAQQVIDVDDIVATLRRDVGVAFGNRRAWPP